MNNKIISVMKCILYLFGLLALSVQAAGYDCAKAATKVEKLICGDAELSKLDEELNAAYKAAVQDKTQAAAVKQAQKQWMKERNGCEDAGCVQNAYRNRINELVLNQRQGRFITVLSKDELLCEAYKHYVLWEINETQNNDRPQYRRATSLGDFGSLTWYENPPQCKRPFGEKFSEFSSVNWREIKPEDYPELSGQAYRYINDWPWNQMAENWPLKNRPDIPQPLSERWFKEGTKEMISQHTINWARMWLGEGDIGNNGHIETLLKVDDGRCAYDPHWVGGVSPARWRVPVMVVDATGKKIDTTKSEWVLGVSVPPKVLKPHHEGTHSLALQSFDVFGFSGHTYYDRWEDEGVDWGEAWTPDMNGQPYGKLNLPKHASLTVYMISQEKAAAVCRFKFNKQAIAPAR